MFNVSTQNEVKVLSHMIINHAISIFHYFYEAIYQKKKHVDADCSHFIDKHHLNNENFNGIGIKMRTF